MAIMPLPVRLTVMIRETGLTNQSGNNFLIFRCIRLIFLQIFPVLVIISLGFGPIIAERFTTTSNDKTSKLDVLYPYFMNNLHLGKEICINHNKLDIELKILNLFNEDYRTVLQHPMPRRNYSLLLRYDF
jgi:outer membrane cobalamin receptor